MILSILHFMSFFVIFCYLGLLKLPMTDIAMSERGKEIHKIHLAAKEPRDVRCIAKMSFIFSVKGHY